MMNENLPEDLRAKIENSLLAGRKIEAIKLYRKQTDCSLAEAKDAVGDMEVQLRRVSPEKFIAAPTAKGCGASALVIAAIIFTLSVAFAFLIGRAL